jgi:hypothetical protein
MIPTRRHGHVVYESSQFRAGIRVPAVGNVEYKRGTDAGVIHQRLFYMAWLMDHKDAFRHLVRDRLGAAVASQVLWGAPRLICVAGDFTRYDVHAVREHRRSIDLVRYRFSGAEHVGLETVACVIGRTAGPRAGCRRRAPQAPRAGRADGAMPLRSRPRGLGREFVLAAAQQQPRCGERRVVGLCGDVRDRSASRPRVQRRRLGRGPPDHAAGRGHSQAARRLQEDVRRGLAVRDLVGRDGIPGLGRCSPASSPSGCRTTGPTCTVVPCSLRGR